MRVMLAIAVLAVTAAIPAGAENDLAAAVTWTWRLVPQNAAAGTEAELVLEADLAPDWIVYSSDFQSELGPLPARLSRPKAALQLLGGLRSISASRARDASLNTEYGYFKGRAELRQRVRLPPDGSALEVTLNGQACYEADGTCHLIRQEIRIAAH
jgi:thiol:disulfide interchange protein DsbD